MSEIIPFEIDTYAVIGNPIAHSKSPLIHAAFAKQTNQVLQYLKIESPLDHFTETVINFQKRRGKGLNITVPFKQNAYQFVSKCSPRAKLVQAVNTIKFSDDRSSYGDSTDGVGLIKDITINHHFSLLNKKILLIGAGGAAQSVLPALFAEKPSFILIGNRTAEKAYQLAFQFADLGKIHGYGFSELPQQPFDLIINCTSASLKGELPTLSSSFITPETFCYDMAYLDKPTVFLQWAMEKGVIKYSDGIGMLIEQAAESFYLWRGIKPHTKDVLKMLRAPHEKPST